MRAFKLRIFLNETQNAPELKTENAYFKRKIDIIRCLDNKVSQAEL